MTRALYLIVLILFLSSCEDRILTTDISKVSVVSFSIDPRNLIGDSLVVREDTDIITTDFEEFSETLESVQVNRIEIQIVNLPSSNTPRLAQISMGVDRNLVDSANVFRLELANLPAFVTLPVTNSFFQIVNTDRILIYERNTRRGIVTDENEGVIEVLSLIENFEPMQLGLGLLFMDQLSAEFGIEVYLDITAKVRLD